MPARVSRYWLAAATLAEICCQGQVAEDCWYNNRENGKTNLWIAWHLKKSQADAHRTVKIIPNRVTAYQIKKLFFFMVLIDLPDIPGPWGKTGCQFQQTYFVTHIKGLSEGKANRKGLPTNKLVSMITAWSIPQLVPEGSLEAHLRPSALQVSSSTVYTVSGQRYPTSSCSCEAAMLQVPILSLEMHLGKLGFSSEFLQVLASLLLMTQEWKLL